MGKLEQSDFYNNLFDGRCKGCSYSKCVSAGNWSFLGCYCEPYKGKWVAEIKTCPNIVGIKTCPNIVGIKTCPNIVGIKACPNAKEIKEGEK